MNTSLNCTMPEFTNNSVGSLPGTKGLDATTAWPFCSKNSRNLLRISADFMVARERPAGSNAVAGKHRKSLNFRLNQAGMQIGQDVEAVSAWLKPPLVLG